MVWSPEENRQLDQMEATAVDLHVDPKLVVEYLDSRRTDWERDGELLREPYANLRSVIVLSIMVEQIAAAHAGCELPDCVVCSALRRALAYAVARARHHRECQR